MRVIIIECEPDELDSVIKRFRLDRLNKGNSMVITTSDQDELDLLGQEYETDTSVPLTEDQKQVLQLIWSRLKPGAQEILTEIARRPNEYPFAELDHQMKIKHPRWQAKLRTGYMSSIGHQWEPFRYRGIPPLLERDWYRRTFKMDPRIAELIRNMPDPIQQATLP